MDPSVAFGSPDGNLPRTDPVGWDMTTTPGTLVGPYGDRPWSAPTAVLWTFMMLLATAIAGYAFRLLIVPAARPEFLNSSPVPLAVRAHLAGGGLALLLGPWQFITGSAGSRNALHRWLGRTYGLSVGVGAGAGLVLAPIAQTGLVAQTGFGLLALATLVATARAIQLARRGDFTRHRQWMIRSYALILAAVTLRFQIPGAIISGIGFTTAYPVIAWACWVPNALVAEWFVRRRPA
jgi:uncharacterized membrane protein